MDMCIYMYMYIHVKEMKKEGRKKQAMSNKQTNKQTKQHVHVQYKPRTPLVVVVSVTGSTCGLSIGSLGEETMSSVSAISVSFSIDADAEPG